MSKQDESIVEVAFRGVISSVLPVALCWSEIVFERLGLVVKIVQRTLREGMEVSVDLGK